MKNTNKTEIMFYKLLQDRILSSVNELNCLTYKNRLIFNFKGEFEYL